MTGDPNRERCGNCGEPWEEHHPVRVTAGGGCEELRRYCEEPPELEFHTSSDVSDWLDDAPTYRPESDEDRIADRAAAMEGGL